MQDYNANAQKPDEFKGLVQPTDSERTLNGFRRRSTKPIDWEKQSKHACEAFDANGFFVLVGDRQVESLDEVVEVKVDTEIAFVKLVLLVGG